MIQLPIDNPINVIVKLTMNHQHLFDLILPELKHLVFVFS